MAVLLTLQPTFPGTHGRRMTPRATTSLTCHGTTRTPLTGRTAATSITDQTVQPSGNTRLKQSLHTTQKKTGKTRALSSAPTQTSRTTGAGREERKSLRPIVGLRLFRSLSPILITTLTLFTRDAGRWNWSWWKTSRRMVNLVLSFVT